MTRPAFQTIVFGQTLAARLCAVLLARQGEQVLHLCPAERRTQPRGSAAPLLVRFLDLLDARSCLITAPPLQILTPESQVELHGETPFRDELRREFPAGHDQLVALFGSLEEQAEKLLEFLWDAEGYPLSLAQRLLSQWQLLRCGLSRSGLMVPFAATRTTSLGAQEKIFLQVLFGALTQTPWEQLTAGEAALVWAEFSAGQSISVSALEEALRNRLRLAGGEQIAYVSNTPVSFEPGRDSFSLRVGEASYQGAQLLVDDPGLPDISGLNTLSSSHCWQAALGQATPSPMLADRLLVGDGATPPARITLLQKDGHWRAIAELCAAEKPDPAILERAFAKLFPFAECRLQLQTQGQEIAPSRLLLGLRQGFKTPSAGIWNLSARALFPTLSFTGECLAAMTLAARLRAE